VFPIYRTIGCAAAGAYNQGYHPYVEDVNNDRRYYENVNEIMKTLLPHKLKDQ
jgi:hypothetical protein